MLPPAGPCRLRTVIERFRERPVTTAVVCDSTSYLPPELLAERGIEQISLYVTVDGDQRRETEIDDYDAFFARIRASKDGATTSQPSVGDFIASYQRHLDAGREIASIHLSAGISGTFESAVQARARLIDEGADPKGIRVYDSRSACGGLALPVLAAAKAAAAGGSAAEAVEAAAELREQMKIWFALDTLEYVRRGGRIGFVGAWLGSALQVKPILTLEEQLTPVERVRTRRRVLSRLLDFARELNEAGRDGWVVQHIQDADSAELLVEEASRIFGCDPLFVSEVGPVIGAHAGPGLLGIGAAPRELAV